MGKTTSAKTRTGSAANAEAPKQRKPGFRIASEPLVGSREAADAHKYEVTQSPVSPAYEELGELPASYGEDSIFLIARDPQWLFTYWDIDWSRVPVSAMKDGQRRAFLKIFNSGGEESTIQINPEARNWYVPVSKAGEDYRVEVGYYDTSDEWVAVVKSGHATTPPSSIAEDTGRAEFATVPMHLTFQRLLEMVKVAMEGGESLLDAVSRLQGEGRKLAFEKGKAPNWTEDQKRVLAALLGDEIIEQLQMGSADIDQLIRKQLAERLNTESASELAIKGRLVELLASGESSMFSGALGGLFSGALGGLFSGALSSGLGSSWSAQPFSQAERGFFMHVNAEVIFYGGTHPDAKVTVDGREIKLNPDGTFRYHFRFPDGSFKVPIVAISPDGVETRSAELELERATERQGEVGNSAQPQYLPAEPMGRQS